LILARTTLIRTKIVQQEERSIEFKINNKNGLMGPVKKSPFKKR